MIENTKYKIAICIYFQKTDRRGLNIKELFLSDIKCINLGKNSA